MKKWALSFLVSLLIYPVLNAKELGYTASTPAGEVVRKFLGIPFSDSVDFIRWHLILRDSSYELSCNYGIGLNNTNGFIKGGQRILLQGKYHWEKDRIQLFNRKEVLGLTRINSDLLHILDNHGRLLIGNGGWSYTLNNLHPEISVQRQGKGEAIRIKDSVIFQGRTPCKIPGILAEPNDCYKIKWLIIFYAEAGENSKGQFRILGTLRRKEGAIKGSWERVKQLNGTISYHLKDQRGNPFINLQELDQELLVFTDGRGKLLVGDEDFSYTLNRKK